MFPICNQMDSFPQPHPHQFYANNYYPAWSYGANFGFPAPVEHHGCCNHAHTYPPPHCSYNARPPQPHIPPQGYYPAHPPYHVPPHFFMEQPSPRYEYDKEMRGAHCCGCPNHLCQPKQNKGVRIEEEREPEPANKDSDSLAPVKFKSEYPFPYVWLPPEYAKDKESREVGDTKSNHDWSNQGKRAPFQFPVFGFPGYDRLEEYKESKDERASESPHKHGDVKGSDQNNAVLPFPMFWFNEYGNKDMKSDQESTHERASESPQKQGDVKGNDQKNAAFPFPVFWYPGYDRLNESGNKDMKSPESRPQAMEERPPKLKIIPVNPPGNGDRSEKPEAVEGRYVEGVVENDAKGNNLNVGKSESTEIKKQPREIPVTQIKEDEKEPREKNPRNQSSSPRKVSKLPPVCLRIDPLPRRKSGGGVSRSPSPPAVKSKVCQDSDRSPKLQSADTKSCSGQVEQVLRSKAEEVQPRKDTNPLGAEENVETSGKDTPRNSDQPRAENIDHSASIKQAPEEQATDDREEVCERERKREDNGSGETVRSMPVEDTAAKQKLSTTEAAVLIQSLYRGFLVRKWQPLNKLKQIAKVREQVNEVGARVQTLESSSELRKDEKQRILIGEAIMNLLLQLDIIQGLHPSVRDVRKSVAKELTCLQEKLDSLFSVRAAEEDKPVATDCNNTEEAPLTLDKGCAKPECVEQQLIDAEPQHKVEAQRSDLATTESSEQADQQLAPEDQVSDTSSKNNSSGSSTDKVEEQLQRPLVEDQLSAMSLTENEFRNDFPPVSDEKTEDADQQLHHPAMLPIENECGNDFLPAQEAAEQLDAGVQLADELVAPSKPSDAESGNDYQYTSPLNVGAEAGAVQVNVESVKVDQKVTGEPGCGPAESTAEVIGMAGEAPKCEVEEPVEPILVMEQRVGSALQIQESIEEGNPCDCKGENRSTVEEFGVHNWSTVEEFGDSCTADIVSEPSPIVDDVNNNQELELQDSGPHNPLQEDSTSLEDMHEKPSIDSEIEAGNCESASRVNEEPKGMVARAQDHHMLDMNGVHTKEDLPVCSNAKEDNVEEQPPEVDEGSIECFGSVPAEPASLTGVVLVDGESNAHGDPVLMDGESDAHGEPKEPVDSGKRGEASITGEKERMMSGKIDQVAADEDNIGEAEEEKLSKENEKLRDVLGKLIQEGEKQMRVISDLNGRIKDLERKLTKKNKLRMRRRPAPASTHLKQRV